ncbi:ninjurin-1-like [Maylandia zebra]|uniref:ninjurin-1-like n=1 Tax=Maylandia zebra TaxID=106582 RepID=UPI00032983CB|nr:ninjurin-1-like [Maylandia zebra]XP_026010217.1 ninjurin-1-like [Astatotilapia calliptera]
MTRVLESDREACSGSCLTILQEEQPDLILSPASSLSAASTAQTPAAGRRMAEHTLNAEDMALNKLGDIEAQPRKALRPIDMNHYATKKRAAQSMLDVALLMANSSQLKTILYVGPQYRFYVPLIMLLTLSSALQVIVGLLLVFIGK